MGPAGPAGPKGDPGAAGLKGDPGPAGAPADLAALRAELIKLGFTVQIIDDQGTVVQTQTITLGGTLKLQLTPVKK
jgi:hypothetical protein